MFFAVLALLARSLRVDTRSLGSNLARLGLMVGIYLFAIETHYEAGSRGAPGLHFFSWIVWCNLAFLTLMGIAIFSSSITEEKEEDSLGLLRMAGVDSIGLLIGKVGGRLMQFLAMLCVQYPFALLAVTLGGVTSGQINAAYVAMVGFTLMLAGVGMLCSTIAATSRSAATLMVLYLVMYILVPLIGQSVLSDMARSGASGWQMSAVTILAESSILVNADSILATGFDAPWWSSQFVSNSVVGLIGLLLAWLLFDVCTRNPRTEPMSRGAVSISGRGIRLLSPGRPWTNSLVWKDFQFATGGIVGLMTRFLLYTLIYVFFVLMADMNVTDASGYFCVMMVFVLPFDASLLVARCLQDEVRGQTISALVMLPQSVPRILYSKLAGALLGLIPGVSCTIVAVLASGMLVTLYSSGGYGLVALVMVVPYMLLMPHLTAVLALVVRWGATPLAFMAFCTLQIVGQMVLVPFLIIAGDGSPLIYMFGSCVINLSVCGACHYELQRRFRKLAET